MVRNRTAVTNAGRGGFEVCRMSYDYERNSDSGGIITPWFSTRYAARRRRRLSSFMSIRDKDRIILTGSLTVYRSP